MADTRPQQAPDRSAPRQANRPRPTDGGAGVSLRCRERKGGGTSRRATARITVQHVSGLSKGWGLEMCGSYDSSSPSKKATGRKHPAKAQEIGRTDTLSAKSSRPGAQWAPALAPTAVCVYIVGFALPFQFQWDIPLPVLASMSVIAFSSFREKRSSWPPLTFPVAIFLAAIGLSILTG